MATISEDYVSFEIAKLLKEKGFNTPLLTFYLTDKDRKEGYFQTMAFTDDVIDNNHSDICYLAPTLQMAMKWLREVHNIAIDTEWEHLWYAYVKPMPANPSEDDYCQRFSAKYEEACEEAIKYCLEHLI